MEEAMSQLQQIQLAPMSEWGWNACIVCGSDAVTDRALSLLLKDGIPTIIRLGWCDSSKECRDDLRQQVACVLLPAEVKAVDAMGAPDLRSLADDGQEVA